ncbi:MAG TPA: inorganic diphosphatase [Bacteroidales bacterium]|nr:inorganic diphosphatase [Bacteroidales bacterium]
MMRLKAIILFLILISGTYACIRPQYDHFAPIGEDHYLRMVVETSAGNTHCVQYNSSRNEFIKGSALKSPAPVNFGFIPSLNISTNKENIDPVHVMLLSDSKPAGTILKIIPVGMLQLSVSDEEKHFILAIPADPSEQKVKIQNSSELSMTNPSIFLLLESWLKNYFTTCGVNIQINGWLDENETWHYLLNTFHLQS